MTVLKCTSFQEIRSAKFEHLQYVQPSGFSLTYLGCLLSKLFVQITE